MPTENLPNRHDHRCLGSGSNRSVPAHVVPTQDRAGRERCHHPRSTSRAPGPALAPDWKIIGDQETACPALARPTRLCARKAPHEPVRPALLNRARAQFRPPVAVHSFHAPSSAAPRSGLSGARGSEVFRLVNMKIDHFLLASMLSQHKDAVAQSGSDIPDGKP